MCHKIHDHNATRLNIIRNCLKTRHFHVDSILSSLSLPKRKKKKDKSSTGVVLPKKKKKKRKSTDASKRKVSLIPYPLSHRKHWHRVHSKCREGSSLGFDNIVGSCSRDYAFHCLEIRAGCKHGRTYRRRKETDGEDGF